MSDYSFAEDSKRILLSTLDEFNSRSSTVGDLFSFNFCCVAAQAQEVLAEPAGMDLILATDINGYFSTVSDIAYFSDVCARSLDEGKSIFLRVIHIMITQTTLPQEVKGATN